MSHLTTLELESSGDLTIDSLVVAASSELSLARWLEVFNRDDGQAQHALAKVQRCVNALKRIKAESVKPEMVERTRSRDFDVGWHEMSEFIERLKDFSGLQQDRSSKPKENAVRKSAPHIQLSKCILNLVKSIDNLGALFELTPTQLKTIKVNDRMRVQRTPRTQSPVPVPADAVALEELASAINAAALAILVEDDAEPSQESINAQITIRACAQSVRAMASQFRGRNDMVDEHLVLPAFEEVRTALTRIKHLAAHKVKLSDAVDDLIVSVRHLAILHHITDTSAIDLPDESRLVDADRPALIALADEIRTAAVTTQPPTTDDPNDRPSVLNACALSLELIAAHVCEKVDPKVVDDAVKKVRRLLKAGRLRSFVSSVRQLAIAHKTKNINDINLPITVVKPRNKKRAPEALQNDESSKRAREASVAKHFEFGRWGGMSERRANIYGLL